ncbi:MAG: sodium-dependent transporter [Halodesulfurarchaeum sp.]
MAERSEWGTRAGFILAAIGSAIGLGNIWRFPYQVYNNGGGAFLIPYFAALLFAGIPVLILEIALGSETQRTTPLAIREKLRESEFVGWWAVLNGFIVNTYYVVILGWALAYIAFSFTLGWGANPNKFFFNQFLSSWYPIAGVVIIWAANFLILRLGVSDGLERANKIFVPAIWVIVILLAIRGITLPGGIEGLNYYLTPDFSALTNTDVWISAFGQIYFTLSVALGIMITYASYQPAKQDISNNAFIIAFANSGFAFLAGFAIFPVMVATGTEPTSGVGLAFVVLPQAFEALPLSRVLSALFFILLTLAGLSSSLSLAEAQIGPFDEKLAIDRNRAVNWVIGAGFIGSVLIALEGPFAILGNQPLQVLTILDTSSATFTLPLIAFGETLIFGWVYGADRIRETANEVSDFHIGRWFDWVIRVLVPVVLGYSILSQAVSKPGLIAPFVIMLSAVIASYIKERRDVVKEETPAPGGDA